MSKDTGFISIDCPICKGTHSYYLPGVKCSEEEGSFLEATLECILPMWYTSEILGAICQFYPLDPRPIINFVRRKISKYLNTSQCNIPPVVTLILTCPVKEKDFEVKIKIRG